MCSRKSTKKQHEGASSSPSDPAARPPAEDFPPDMRHVSGLTLDLLRLGMSLTSQTINAFHLLERTVGSTEDLSEMIAGLTLSLEHDRAVYDNFKALVVREFPDLEDGAVGDDAGADAGGDGAPPS